MTSSMDTSQAVSSMVPREGHRLPAVLGHGGISGGSEQPGEVLGVGAAFSYQPVKKYINILETAASCYPAC